MKTTNQLINTFTLGLLAAFLVGCGEDKGSPSASTPEAKSTPVAAEGGGIEVHEISACPTGEGCFICDASKREAGRLWCKEHHRYEDRCFDCHPDLKEKDRLYCTEHGVYENECYLCHPDLKKTGASDAKTSSNTKPAKVLMCNEHGVPEAECAVCQPGLAAGLAPGQSLKIRVASAAAMEKVGVEVSRPTGSTSSTTVEAYASVDYNQNRVAKITPLVEGIVHEISAVPGQQVAAGEILGQIHSPQFADAKSRFLSSAAARKLARLRVERERRLAAKQISAASDLETAEASAEVAEVDFAAARQHLLNLDLSEQEFTVLAEQGLPTAMLALKAPFAGTIVEREVAPGERVAPGDAIFQLADLSSMWLELSIPARDAAPLKPGMPVRAHFADLPGTIINAELIWISSAIDEKTRRIRARALVTDPPSALRKGLYGEASIQLSADSPSLAVPTSAIQTIDGVPFVFVRKEPALFAATRVESAGRTSDGQTAIRRGLAADDQVVTAGSYILRSEFLKSLLGAGCVDD
jgi:cobalt-zinc-cadmium efflux system membrane fusion protein